MMEEREESDEHSRGQGRTMEEGEGQNLKNGRRDDQSSGKDKTLEE